MGSTVNLTKFQEMATGSHAIARCRLKSPLKTIISWLSGERAMFVLPLRRFALIVVLIVALGFAGIGYLTGDLGLRWDVAVLGDCAVVAAALFAAALIVRVTSTCPRYFAAPRVGRTRRGPESAAQEDFRTAARRQAA
jgi:hypothetical protein